MIREISQLRSAIMKRNATLFDWFVQHVGSSQIPLIHKMPLHAHADSATPSAKNNGNALLLLAGVLLKFCLHILCALNNFLVSQLTLTPFLQHTSCPYT